MKPLIFSARAVGDSTTTHSATTDSVSSTRSAIEYRFDCACGYHSDWTPDLNAAETAAHRHIRREHSEVRA